MKPKKRLVFITNIPNNYRIPLFNELSKQLQQIDYELHVVFGAIGYNQRKGNVDLSDCIFNYSVLDSGLFSNTERKTGFLFYTGLLRLLSKLQGDEIIVTGFALSTIKIWLSTFVCSRTYHIISGSIDSNNNSRSWIRNIQRKVLIQKASGFIAYGSLAKKYLVNLGAEPSNVICMGNTVDTDYYRIETARYKQENHSTDDIKNLKHLTYIGYVNARKNVDQLIFVLEKLLTYRKDIVLDIIGDGESLNELKSIVLQRKLQDHVVFHGFIQKEELPKHLAKSAIFLFQTSFDIWGLVLNEAMAAGVPCLASINAGASVDLIDDGITGFIVNFNEHVKTADKINWMLDHPLEMDQIGKNASDFISKEYSLQSSAQRIISLFQ